VAFDARCVVELLVTPGSWVTSDIFLETAKLNGGELTVEGTGT